MMDFQIIVEAFQEDSIGEFKLYDGTVLWIGHNQAGVSILSKQNSLIFEPGLLPLSAGTFKIRFIATFKNEQSEKVPEIEPEVIVEEIVVNPFTEEHTRSLIQAKVDLILKVGYLSRYMFLFIFQ